MPSLELSNSHDIPKSSYLQKVTYFGTPLFSSSAVNGVYNAVFSCGFNVGDTSLVNTTAGQQSGIVLSGKVRNVTQKKDMFFNYPLPSLAWIGATGIFSFNLPLTTLGLDNPSAGDQLQVSLNITLKGAYVPSPKVITLNLS